ncbi:MAG: type II toxin-antitoxin system VapC family toxin [Gemmatimonadetes bacterium]|nr:type II toxin-antitoxin system VapC family toxin [Gemmatimonadota bacterium]
MILLDTHALLWWALDPGQLSEAATKAVRTMEQQGGYASSISLWELGIKVQRGQLELPISVDELAKRVEHGGAVELVAVDTNTWLRTVRLDWAHRDPADRVIVATALIKGVPVLTKDRALHEFGGVECIW